MRTRWLSVLATLLMACPGPAPDTDADTDTDVGTDVDTDTDADTGTDADSDTDPVSDRRPGGEPAPAAGSIQETVGGYTLRVTAGPVVPVGTTESGGYLVVLGPHAVQPD